MNSKIDKNIAQNCLKIAYENGKNTAPIRLLDAKSLPKPFGTSTKIQTNRHRQTRGFGKLVDSLRS